MDPIGWLNDNAGVLTLAFVVLTFLTLLEARATRIATTGTAHVAFRPDIDRLTGLTLKLRLLNHGPAVAEDVQIAMQWFEGAAERSPRRTMVEPVLGTGDARVYLPDLLLTGRETSLAKMGGLLLKVEWSWLDERHNFFLPWSRVRSRGGLELDAGDFAASMHGGPLVLEEDPLIDEVRGVGEQLKELNQRERRRDLG